ncbi:acyltransferase [Pontibacter saemangeumensis]|uniref:acyltransferase family protein n=1 Tax=Pontibacter saemangeumensis TaxID=1084525 RepID=UPI0031EAB8F6
MPSLTHDRIEVFDLLRTLAVSTVVLVHFSGVPLKGSLAGSAVDLFFVLSAILVSQPLLSAYKDRQSANLTEFYVKRITKIIPSYYFFIFSGYLIAYLFIMPISPENVIKAYELPEYLLFYRNLAGPPPRLIFEHVWSLCVEEQFYLILPLGFYIARKLSGFSIKKLVLYLAGVALLGIVFKLQALLTSFAEWPTYTHNRIDAFAWGILTLIFLKSRYIETSVRFRRLQPLFLIIGISTLCVFLAVDYTATDPHELILRTVSPICWSLIIIGSFHYKIHYANAFKRVAIYSYNLYLWHFLLIIPVEYYFGTGIKGFIIYMFLSCAFAIFATHLIENKFLRYRIPLILFLKRMPRTKAETTAYLL